MRFFQCRTFHLSGRTWANSIKKRMIPNFWQIMDSWKETVYHCIEWNLCTSSDPTFGGASNSYMWVSESRNTLLLGIKHKGRHAFCFHDSIYLTSKYCSKSILLILRSNKFNTLLAAKRFEFTTICHVFHHGSFGVVSYLLLSCFGEHIILTLERSFSKGVDSMDRHYAYSGPVKDNQSKRFLLKVL